MRLSIPLKDVVLDGVKPWDSLFFNFVRIASKEASGDYTSRNRADSWVSYSAVHYLDRLGKIKLSD